MPFPTPPRPNHPRPTAKWLIQIREGHHLTFGGAEGLRRAATTRPGLNLPTQPAATVNAQHDTITRYTLAMFLRYLCGDASADKALSSGDEWTSRFVHERGTRQD